MMDDPVADAATKVKLRRTAMTTTTALIKRRLDPRLVVADMAKLAMARSLARVTGIKVTPAQRKRALIGAGIAAATTIVLRVVYRNARENTSPDAEVDVKRLT
jgi:hypothetical protein